MAANTVFLKHPHGAEIKEVEATAEALIPLMGMGWSQVPAPTVQQPEVESGIIRDSEEHGLSRIRDKPWLGLGYEQVREVNE